MPEGASRFTTQAEQSLFDDNVKDAAEVLDAAVAMHRTSVAEHGEVYALATAYTACSLIDEAAAATMLAVAISRLAARPEPDSS